LFETGPAWPDGFLYRENVVSDTEEAACVQAFETLPSIYSRGLIKFDQTAVASRATLPGI